MILLFPDLGTLHLALTSGAIGSDAMLAPATVSFDADNRPHVESSISLSKTTVESLKRLGVKGSKHHESETPEQVANWLQILPAVKDSVPPVLSSQAPVLFELTSAADFTTVATEMLRLGNDRQSFRWFADANDANARILLRVVGPPYYTLLRALDRTSAASAGPVRAYLERAPRVWVEVGFTHPLVNQLRVAEGQFVLVRPPRAWVFLNDAPFRDVYDVLQFQIPASPTVWKGTKNLSKIEVPLQFTAGNAADSPELWVLRDDPIRRLDTLVRDSSDSLISRLMFAIATDEVGNTAAIVRARPSKLPPPVVPLEAAIGFRPFSKLTNLYVPVGKRLHPTLRRDAVRKLLADDPDRVVWLYPNDDGKHFTPENVPDGAFRLLEDWVDYVIEAEEKPLAAWIESTRFDFDHFICRETDSPTPKGPGSGRESEPKEVPEESEKERTEKRPKPGKKPKEPRVEAAEFIEPAKKPNEWLLKRKELEEEFTRIDGPLDAPERRALWPQLAAANAGAGDATEAAICWLHALWDAGDPPPAAWISDWVKSESALAGEPLDAAEFDRRLAIPLPTAGEARGLLVGFLHLASQSPPPPWLAARLPAVQQYLEKHERSLPVRAVWIIGRHLSRLAGADVLGLARIRDRLLQRLLDEGLSPERDMPGFLRYAGLRDSERLRAVRDKALDLHAVVRKWIADFHGPHKESLTNNLPYIDLYFAFALAKLGETTPAHKLLHAAKQELETPIPTQGDKAIKAAVVKNALYQAYHFRIEQAIAGKPHTGPLSPEAQSQIDAISKKAQNPATRSPFWEAEYVIGRMRQESFILDPHERVEPYSVVTRTSDPLARELMDLASIREPVRMVERIRKLYRGGVPNRPLAEVRFLLLREALPLSARAGESFAAEFLQLVPATLAEATMGPPEPANFITLKGDLFERALFLAAHFDRNDLIQNLVAQFMDFLHRITKEDDRFKVINVVAGQCLQSLRKVGLREQIDRLLSKFHEVVLKGMSFAELRARYTSRSETGATWGRVLETLLNIAAGWLTFGLTEQATPILDEARSELFAAKGSKLEPKDILPVSRAYIAALGNAPSEIGLARIRELFEKMEAGRFVNTWTGSMIYSRHHLSLVEAVVLALVGDNSALGPTGRRWLDDDEYLVRRRIHSDMRQRLESGGY